MRPAPRRFGLIGLLVLAGCGGGSPGGVDPGKPRVLEGTAVAVTLSPAQKMELDRLAGLQAETASLAADDLLTRRTVPWKTDLGYDPKAAKNLDKIQASALKLDEAELAALGRNGFVISDKQRYPHFGYGYKTIYSQDLPVFVSADSILQAVHQSYDDILKAIELEALIPELKALLAGMRTRLAASPQLEAQTRKDVDLFLAVALGLLEDGTGTAVAGANPAEIKQLLDGALAANGAAEIALFGVADRIIDFSIPPSPTCTLPPRDSTASPMARCCTWARAGRG